MKYQDVVYAGAPVVLGLDPNFNMKGYRVIPLLAAGATRADAIAAYAPLVMESTRNSQSRAISNIAPGIVDSVPVNDPAWIRSPGFNLLTLSVGLVGTTYRVWWAEDCFEIMDASTPPYLEGFAPGTPSATGTANFIGPAGAATQAAGSAAGNIPTAAGDGLELPAGARGVRVSISAAAGQTLSALAGGGIVLWRISNLVPRWQESEVLLTYPSGVARRDATVEINVATALPGDRIYAEARSCPTSAGALQIGLSVSQ